MKKVFGILAFVIASVLSFVQIASGGTVEMSGADLSVKRFVANFAAAVNSKDPARIKKLVHPKSLRCITKDSKDFFDSLFEKDMSKHIPSDYRVETQAVAGSGPLPFADEFTYPIRPTHLVQIDYERGPNNSVTMVRQIVKEGGRWLMVMPCPTPETLMRFRETKISKTRHEERVKMLFSDLKEPLLSELKALLKEGRKVDAIKRYSVASGEDLATAKDVITILNAGNE